VIEGVKLGFAKGFFDDGSKYEIKLTGTGFAAISASNETIKAMTTSNTHETN
jgi:hypothetical protein